MQSMSRLINVPESQADFTTGSVELTCFIPCPDICPIRIKNIEMILNSSNEELRDFFSIDKISV